MAMNRFPTWLMTVTVAVGIGVAARADAPASTQPEKNDNVARALRIADPDIAAIKKLKYKDVDLTQVDIATKTEAIMAVNKLLGIHGQRAKERVSLLEDYIQSKGLSDEFSKNSSPVPEDEPLSLDDGVRTAVAMLQTDEGKATYGKDFTGAKPEELQRTYINYYKLCMKQWGEVAYSRFRVEELASFVDSKGLLNDFISWAKDERARQKQVKSDEMAKLRAQQKADDEIARGKRIEKFEKDQARQDAIFMKRLEYAAEVESARASAPRYYWGGYW